MPNRLQIGTLIFGGEVVVPPENGVLYRPSKEHSAPKIVDTQTGKAITWIVVGGKLIADRCLLRDISYFTIDTEIMVDPHSTHTTRLDDYDYLEGTVLTGPRRICLDGREYILRLPQVGKCKGVPNEWDSALNDVGDSNLIWHWSGIYSWGSDITDDDDYPGYLAVRGYDTPRTWAKCEPDISDGYGWRPVLEPVSVEPSPELIGREVAVWHGQQIICGLLDSYTAYDIYLARARKVFTDDGKCEHWYEHLPDLKIVVDRTKISALHHR